MTPTREEILAVLEQIKDPRSGNSAVQSQLIESFQIEGSKIFLLLNTRNLPPDLANSLNFQCVQILEEAFPGILVEIKKNEVPRPTKILPQVKYCIAIASGKGGVGKSTITSNLACSLAMQGFRVGLIDADLYGPSIPTMFGVQGMRPSIDDVHGKPMLVPIKKHGVYLMSIGFVIDPEQAVILRGPRLSGILKQFLQDTVWPELDFLLFDLPPGTGDIQLTLVQSLPIDGAIIVTTPQKISTIDALKAISMFKMPSIEIPILGIVENMSWFSPAEDEDTKYFIFGKGGGLALAEQERVDFLGSIPLVMSAMESSDNGTPSILDDSNFYQNHFKPISDKLLKSFQFK